MAEPAGPTGGRHELMLVRHGETEWSLSGQHTSRTDLPLTEGGRERARALEGRFAGRSFALVLSSPLRRARETCELAGLGGEMELCEDLHEWDYGDYEGLTTPQIREQNPDWVLWRDGCPGGETPDEVGARADRALGRLRAAGGDEAVGHPAAPAMQRDVEASERAPVDLELDDEAR